MAYKDPNDPRAKARRREWYYRNRDRANLSAVRRKQEIREWFKELKSHLYCEICDESESVCLDFHHSNDNKDRNVSLAVSVLGWSRERILAEIDKCNVLCSNCHRKRHAGLV